MSATRHQWVDSAKAISIVLVVLWHTVGDAWLFNELLLYLRMPLFFFVAGFFAARSLDGDWPTFLSRKVGHFMYLYVFWCAAAFLLTAAPGALKDGQPIPFEELTAIFTTPPLTLWFIYALAIVFVLAKILKNADFRFVLCLSLILYCWSVADGDWRRVSFLDQILRLAPFFLLGTVAFGWVASVPRQFDGLALPLLAAYFALAYLLHSQGWAMLGPLTLIATALGVAGVLLLSRLIQRCRLRHLVNHVGRHTLHIYVLHRIIIAYLEQGYGLVRMNESLALEVVTFGLAVAGSLVLGTLLQRQAPWVFEAPWIRRPSLRRGRAVAS